MSETWLTRRQLWELTGWSARTIDRKADAGELKWRCGEKRLRNGKLVREFALSSLPAEAQARLITKQLEPCSFPSDVIAAPRANEIRIAVTPEQQEEAYRRLEAINPIMEFRRTLELRRGANGRRPVLHLPTGRELRSFPEVVLFCAYRHGVSERTIWRWYTNYLKRGYDGLVDPPRRDKNKSRYFIANPAAAIVVQHKYFAERLSIRLSHEALCREAKERGWRYPSYETVRNYLRLLPEPVITLARQGRKAFNETCTPFRSRDYESLCVNEYWVADHRRQDVLVSNDIFDKRDGAAVRLQLTMIQDARSRMALGWAWSINASSESIASALRMAMSRHGVPEMLYFDNGSDFKRVGRMLELAAPVLGLLDKLNIAIQHCLPYNAQAKPVEALFSTMSKRFDPLWGDAYAGRDAKLRSESCRAAELEHKKFLAGKAPRSPLPAASEFVRAANYWIENEYNARHRHTGQGMNGRTPAEVFDELHAAPGGASSAAHCGRDRGTVLGAD